MRGCLGETDEQIRPAVLEQALAVGEALLGIRSERCRVRIGRSHHFLDGSYKAANVVFSYVNRDLMTALAEKKRRSSLTRCCS